MIWEIPYICSDVNHETLSYWFASTNWSPLSLALTCLEKRPRTRIAPTNWNHFDSLLTPLEWLHPRIDSNRYFATINVVFRTYVLITRCPCCSYLFAGRDALNGSNGYFEKHGTCFKPISWKNRCLPFIHIVYDKHINWLAPSRIEKPVIWLVQRSWNRIPNDSYS